MKHIQNKIEKTASYKNSDLQKSTENTANDETRKTRALFPCFCMLLFDGENADQSVKITVDRITNRPLSVPLSLHDLSLYDSVFVFKYFRFR